MFRAYIRFQRYLVSALCSFVIGLLLWFYNHDKDAALIVGLLVNLTFLIIDHLNVLDRTARYLDVYGEIIDSSDKTLSIATKVGVIDKLGNDLQRKLARARVSMLEETLAELTNGRWRATSFDEFVVTAEALFTQKPPTREYCGISVVSDFRDYWPNVLGKRFLAAQVNAIKLGASIRRVFVIENADDLKSVMPKMVEQAKCGISVKYVARSEAPYGASVLDGGVWDDLVSTELSDSRHAGAEFCAAFSFNASEVSRIRQRFDALYNCENAHTVLSATSNVVSDK